MKKIASYNLLLMFAFIFVVKNGNAQTGFNMSTEYFQDGVPRVGIKDNHYTDIEGSPYFYSGWAEGQAKLSDGKTYTNLLLKYDEIEGSVSFKYKPEDTEMAFAVPAVEFSFVYITDDNARKAHFMNGFAPVHNTDGSSFYQVLSNGNTKLLKRTVKKILKSTEYNATAITRHVEETTTYYLAKDKTPVKINNSNKAVLAALGDKADRLKKYIPDYNIDAKNDDDFAKLIDYYNTL